ncbi:hypothetical protein CISIN_1g038382mg [Citrus sinensis]|uniref:DUF4371 domain-containing protein n=1 Tax=Citrus sinensis TaxID=2711 RepID=A0A067EE32_CITSI|nr:hypothetical protein CISIN_1g038382mg [Citrus sinensis]
MLKWGGLKNASQHIDRVMNAQSSQQILQNRLWLQTSIEAVKWLAKQACAFRGHDESIKSSNSGNFIKMIKYSARMNKDIVDAVLENASGSAKYTSSDIQKELLNIISNRVWQKIQQIAIILRYVDCDGFVRERFFEVVNVKETSASTLKNERCKVLTLKVSKDVPDVWIIFSTLNSIVNVFGSSRKRHSELKSITEAEIIDLIASGELETATRWSSHFTSVSRLISMFGVVHEYLEKMICNGSNNDIRGEAKGVYNAMSTFTFVFILHLMNKVLGISDLLCQALQMKSQDILNAIHLISATKSLLQSLRENGWDTFIKSVISFCESHHIDVPGMNDRHMKGIMHSCQQKGYVTVEHYYRIDLFNVIIDFQLMKLNNRFIDQMMGLLTLSSALNLVDSFKSFNVNDICKGIYHLYTLNLHFYKSYYNTLRVYQSSTLN